MTTPRFKFLWYSILVNPVLFFFLGIQNFFPHQTEMSAVLSGHHGRFTDAALYASGSELSYAGAYGDPMYVPVCAP